MAARRDDLRLVLALLPAPGAPTLQRSELNSPTEYDGRAALIVAVRLKTKIPQK
jgi:hypothetical protein